MHVVSLVVTHGWPGRRKAFRRYLQLVRALMPRLTPNVLPSVSRTIDRAMAGHASRRARRDRAPVRMPRVMTFRCHRCSCRCAQRATLPGIPVTYVVNRNINYTNVCYFRCQFCAFSKGKMSENLRGEPYVLNLEEIERRTREAWQRGASEVCLQGGIHPELHRRHLSRDLPSHKGGRAGHSHSRILTAGDLAGRRDQWCFGGGCSSDS